MEGDRRAGLPLENFDVPVGAFLGDDIITSSGDNTTGLPSLVSASYWKEPSQFHCVGPWRRWDWLQNRMVPAVPLIRVS